MATKPLVIVESPAKARTISRFLGADYVVESSVGHIRDLPSKADEVPEQYKGEAWAKLGVDVDHDFAPLYVINPDKKRTVAELKKKLKNASELYLATDEDREGEAIAWHLLEVLKPKVPVRRMVFHEITQQAIEAALAAPRDLDQRLVEAQEARRILDRLYGYEVSPVLWKKVNPGLSAGRVQSVATRIVVERERERMAFVPAAYWGITAELDAVDAPDDTTGGRRFPAVLTAVDGQRLATGRDFDNRGQLTSRSLVLDQAAAEELVAALDGVQARVEAVERKPYRRRPAPPFSTSTLQQEAGRKLRFSSQRTMQIAQRLYENGYITYMRTDSVTLSSTAVRAARAQIRDRYGADYVPDQPRTWTGKVKNAQEAHEAIRPAGDTFRTPDEVKHELGAEERRLYELIWMRTIASQMPDATGERVAVRLAATTADGRTCTFAASGLTITFPGFLRAYVEGSDDPEAELDDAERHLPPLSEGQAAAIVELEAEGHETRPPARFTEASLVKRLEELGVGRPSTYASIISTIIGRGYVWRRGSALVPSFTAFAVVTLLERHFPDLVDYAFTARMEDDLDDIAAGEAESVPWLTRFYFGDAERAGLKTQVAERLGELDAAAINSIPIGKDAEGREIVARVGRYGPYLQRGEDTASIPDDVAPDELDVARALELLEAPGDDRVLGTDPDSGLPVVVRNGRFGPYVQLGAVDDGKPAKTGSLLSSMDPQTITLEDGLKVLSLPRVVGHHPDDGAEITAQNGRYGPYIKWGKESRSLESEEQLFTLTLDEALELLRQPKRGRGQRENPVLRELGTDPTSGKPMTIRTGRFGPYVTDGEVNASLRKGDTVEQLTDARASELLAMRRERMAAGGGKGRGRSRKGS